METAQVHDEVRAALRFIETMTSTPDLLNPDHFRELRRAGLSDQAIDDVILICTLFNMIDRLADAFEFFEPDEDGYRQGAAMLLKQGYALPPPLRWSNSVD